MILPNQILFGRTLKDSKYQIVARGEPYDDESWVGKLLGSGAKESDRRVDVLLMER